VQEVNEMKLRFFTNISHEFRTPLTLILAPVQELLSVENMPLAGKKKLQLIEQNSKRLLRLVGQLLDFRKAETGKMTISVSKFDLIKFLKQEVKAFRGLAESNQVKLSFQSDVSQMMLWFDSEKMGIVMNNLLSNAFKHVPQDGEISVKQDMHARIEVRDNGKGIPKTELKRIFDRFYQVDSTLNRSTGGSGIGLALTKRIVELHQGNISVESTRDVETVFFIDLLLGKEHFSEDQIAQDEIFEEATEDFIKSEQHTQTVKPEIKNAKGEKKTLLIVEDQEDINNYIADLFHEDYNVIQKFDGVEGYANCMQTLPDLIISDVMMPGMDGFEFCEKVKKQERTAHIPVILLTAKTADQFKIKGITIGADAYITKPFNMDLLMLRVNKLLEKKSQQQKHFQKTIKVEPGEIKITSMDEELIKKAIALVEKNIAEANYSVEDFSRDLGMSRVYLYKKMTSLTGKSPIEFIRIIRLKRAAQLLEKSQKNISQVAYDVGFNSPRLFSKYFRKEYGMLPTAFVKAKNKNN